ncbi:MAG: hypothetical protein ACI8PZ_001844 [Myxococcota bacterium]|jgi:hypothetical protein
MHPRPTTALALALALAACGPKASTDSAVDSASDAATGTGPATGTPSGTTTPTGTDTTTTTDTSSDLDALEAALWAAYLAAAPPDWVPTPTDTRVEQSLTFGSSTMRYTVERRGASSDPVPLYIALHGGGGAEAWVNDSQWEGMQTYYRDSVSDGIYVAPRGISNNWNLHFESDSYPLYDMLVERMIVQENVDPDRVYLLGFSAGGDGVYQVAPRLADRWAGANMSAGHPNGTPSDNLANVPFLIQMGELDTAYDRHTEAARYSQQLDGLETAHPGLYTHALFLHKDGTHNSPWSDRDPSGADYPVIRDPDAWLSVGDRSSIDVDSNAVHWLDDHARAPHPRQLVWALGTWAEREGRELAHYWLAVDSEHRDVGRVEAGYDPADNSVRLAATDVLAVRVRLNHRMLDLAAPIVFRVDDLEVPVELAPSEDLMAATLALRGDPRQIYSVEVLVEWTADGVTVTPVTAAE